MTMMGLKHSQETRDKIAAAHRGMKHSPEARAKMVGNKNGWKGGRFLDGKGYVTVASPTHPHRSRAGYVLEHRLVMEAYLGRPLLPTEVCHHINGIRDDNRIENLMLFSSDSEHASHHGKERAKP